MAFPLGIAIADLFQRIADLLKLSWFPPPGPPGSGGGGGGGGGGPDDDPDIIDPPPVPPPPPPPVPPPIVDVPPPGGPIPPPPTDDDGCPIVPPSQLTFLQQGIYTAFAPVGDPSLVQASSLLVPEVITPMALAQPTGQYLQSEDSFRFRAFSTSDNVPVTFFGRIQYPTGGITPFAFVLNTSTPNTVFQTVVQAAPGVLLSCAASVPIDSITLGTVSAIGEVGRVVGSTFTPHTLLFSGQLDDFSPLSNTLASPGQPVQRPTFRGANSFGSEASPKDVVITPITGRGIRITRLEAQLIASASAGNRAGEVLFFINGLAVWRGDGGTFFTANQQVKIVMSIGGQSVPTQDAGTDNGALLNCPLPESLYFYEAVTVEFVIAAALAGDTISNATIKWEDV